jgi:hypothetical protein
MAVIQQVRTAPTNWVIDFTKIAAMSATYEDMVAINEACKIVMGIRGNTMSQGEALAFHSLIHLGVLTKEPIKE